MEQIFTLINEMAPYLLLGFLIAGLMHAFIPGTIYSYSQHSISEIAYTIGYSSPAHLTSQFKQQTGMSPKEFREMKSKNRLHLDKL